MASKNWGKLVRDARGCNNEVNVPEVILLFDETQYIGRLPNVDYSKFSHSHQLVIPAPFMSSTHFCVEMKQKSPSGDGLVHETETTFFLTDYSRNGTFFRRKHLASHNIASDVETMGKSRIAQIYDGDEIILKFKNEIKLIYVFVVENRVTAGSKKSMTPAANVQSRPSTGVKVMDGDDILSSRNNIMDENEISVNSKTVIEGRHNNGLLKQQVESLQQENKAQESRLTANIATNESLTATLSAREKELKNLQSVCVLKDAEIVSMTTSLRGSEANSAATEARLRNLEDTSEVVK